MIRHRQLGTAAGWFGGLFLALLAVVFVSGCSSGNKKDHENAKDAHAKKDKDAPKDHANHKDHDKPVSEEDIKAERDKLRPEDRKLVDAQDFCPIMPDSRLGGMGAPVKVMLKDKMGMDQAIFVCCKGCVKKAERKPDETLAKVAELKARSKSGPR